MSTLAAPKAARLDGAVLPPWVSLPGLAELWDWIRSPATVVTDLGLDIFTARLRGVGTEPVYIGWGTGAGTAGVTDTTLFTEKAVDLSAGTGTRTTGTSSQQTTSTTDDTYRVTGTRTATGAGTVTNGGLWDDVDITEGQLFLKGDHGNIVLASGDSIAYTINAQLTN